MFSVNYLRQKPVICLEDMIMNKIMECFNNIANGYNHKRYWKYRFKLYSSNTSTVMRLFYTYKCKVMEGKNNASLGVRPDGGSVFEGTPFLPHGIKGIFITPYSHIGKNVTIQQQTTIGERSFGSHIGPVIGDNVFIGVGARILGNVKVGNNVKIGANAVVLHDIPDNCTVVGIPARVVKKNQ